jgi:NADPH2:quinone reductase
MPLQLPITLGGDFSGVVEAVGPGVADCKARDELYGHASLLNGGSGSFAEFVIAGGA